MYPKESQPPCRQSCRERVDRFEQLDEDPKDFFSGKSLYPSKIASPLHGIRVRIDEDNP